MWREGGGGKVECVEGERGWEGSVWRERGGGKVECVEGEWGGKGGCV